MQPLQIQHPADLPSLRRRTAALFFKNKGVLLKNQDFLYAKSAN
ncbi:hypothetical protein HMPREF1545_00947 [Oscillibacter sp. KLE 1728]|nr:hypothetical protein HMPREF1545_00947 [Oscillibacter sp. KLE 1728]ERK66161.1 hypothetical protein HMPREF1546_01017 [Oscillibacter sp. KLE 1745]